MATLNLGRIKPVFRGAYDASTGYVVDDIVTSGDETFICILASTGNATSNATYWTKLAAKGTDGTDVGTTITTQGDILYRDGSGLQRLAKPASDKFLQNTSGGVLSWEAVSSNVVKLAEQDMDSTGVSSFEFQNCFSSTNDSTYRAFLIMFSSQSSSTGSFHLRYLTGTNTEISGSSAYRRAGADHYRKLDNSDNSSGASNDGDGRDSIDFDGWGQRSALDEFQGTSCSMWFPNSTMYGGTSQNRDVIITTMSADNSSPSYIIRRDISYRCVDTQNYTGLKFYASSGNMKDGKCTLWGYK